MVSTPLAPIPIPLSVPVPSAYPVGYPIPFRYVLVSHHDTRSRSQLIQSCCRAVTESFTVFSGYHFVVYGAVLNYFSLAIGYLWRIQSFSAISALLPQQSRSRSKLWQPRSRLLYHRCSRSCYTIFTYHETTWLFRLSLPAIIAPASFVPPALVMTILVMAVLYETVFGCLGVF